MSELLEPDSPQAAGGGTEEVDAVVVAPALRAIPALPSTRAVVPAVQAAAVAVTGFVAGVAVMGLAHRRQRRRDLLRGGGKRRLGRRTGGGGTARGAGELLQIVSSRSLLVDVHLLGGRD